MGALGVGATTPDLLAVLIAAGAVSNYGPARQGPAKPTAGQPSEPDAKLIARVDGYVGEWNAASGDWSRIYESGDRAAFLKAQRALITRLHKVSLRIRLTASQFADDRLRSDTRRLGEAYRGQFHAVVRVDDSAVNADLRAGQRAIAQLHRAGERKLRVTERLVDEYPVLGADLTG